MKEVAFALYPKIKIRELLMALGRSLLSLSQHVPDLVVQVLYASPFSPCTATILLMSLVFTFMWTSRWGVNTPLEDFQPRIIGKCRTSPDDCE